MIPSAADRGTPPRTSSTASFGAVWQFRTSSLLWLTFTAAMTLAYARLFGTWAMGVIVVVPLVAALWGAMVGWLTRRITDAIYWAVIGATLGAICVVGAPISQPAYLFWPVLGAVVGGAAAAYRPHTTWREWLIAVALGIGMWSVVGPGFWSASEFGVDLSIAPIITVGLAQLIQVIDGLQARYHTSRDAWAAGLVFAVIAGNLWAAMVAGRWG